MDPLVIMAAVLLLSGPRSGADIPDDLPSAKGAQAVMEAAAACGVDRNWQRFLAAVAFHESRWSTNVGLGVASKLGRDDVKMNEGHVGELESKAATAAYRRHVRDHGLWEDCGYPEEAYGFGSGGWYGFLPVFGLWPFRNTPARCMDPRVAVFDPIVSTIMAIAYAQRTMKRSTFRDNPTWRNLNRAWKSPGLMDGIPADVVAKVDARFDKSLKALGLPPSWGDQRVDALPAGWSAYDTLVRLKGAQA